MWPRQYLVWHSGECKSVVSHFAPVKSLPLTPNNRGVGDPAMAVDRKSITPPQPLYQLHPTLLPPPTHSIHCQTLPPPPFSASWQLHPLPPSRSTVHTTTLINRPSACGTTADEVLLYPDWRACSTSADELLPHKRHDWTTEGLLIFPSLPSWLWLAFYAGCWLRSLSIKTSAITDSWCLPTYIHQMIILPWILSFCCYSVVVVFQSVISHWGWNKMA